MPRLYGVLGQLRDRIKTLTARQVPQSGHELQHEWCCRPAEAVDHALRGCPSLPLEPLDELLKHSHGLDEEEDEEDEEEDKEDEEEDEEGTSSCAGQCESQWPRGRPLDLLRGRPPP